MRPYRIAAAAAVYHLAMQSKDLGTIEEAVRAALSACRGEWGLPQTIIVVRGRFRCVDYSTAEAECRRCRGKVVVSVFNPKAPPPRAGRVSLRRYFLDEDA